MWVHFANRADPSVQETVGMLANTHLIGVDMGGDPSFTELAVRVRRAVLGAIQFQDLPLDHLWQSLGCMPRPDDAMVLLDVLEPVGWSDKTIHVDGLAIRRLEIHNDSGPRLSRLGIHVRAGDGHTSAGTIACRHVAELIPSHAVFALLDDVRTVLLNAAKAPTSAVSVVTAQLRGQYEATQDGGAMAEFLGLESELLLHIPVAGADGAAE